MAIAWSQIGKMIECCDVWIKVGRVNALNMLQSFQERHGYTISVNFAEIN